MTFLLQFQAQNLSGIVQGAGQIKRWSVEGQEADKAEL